MELVRALARTLGFNNSALARAGNVPLASLVRYFKGEGEPKIEFLLSVVRALGLEVREFFELAYPPPKGPSASRLKIERILGPVRPGGMFDAPTPEPEPEVPSLQREDIEKMMDQLRHDVRSIMDEQVKKETAPPSKPPRPQASKKGR
jgi:transcriptional regulator with XRE-family HTH domain